MIKKILHIFLLATFLVSTVANAEVTDNEKRYCDVLAQYAWFIAHGRFGMGLTEEQQGPYLDKNYDVPVVMVEDIRKIILTVYDEDFPIIKDAASIAAFSWSTHEACLKEFKND